MKTLILIAVAAGAGMLRAQTASLSALAPVSVQVQLNAQAQSATAPIGPLASLQHLQAELGVAGSASHAMSHLFWNAHASSTSVTMLLSHHAIVATTGAARAEVVACDLLLQLSNPTPIAVQLELRDWVFAPAGVPMPTVRIDVDNDGVFEFTENMPNPGYTVVPAVLGPTPLPVRVQYMASLTTPGTIYNGLGIEVTPVGVAITNAAIGCDPSHNLFLAPTFDHGVAMYVHGVPQEPAVIVFGLRPQPVILPSNQWFPCLLIPAQDAFVLRLDSTFFVLSLPPAVRPIGVLAQPVIIRSSSLQTGNGVQIYAY